MSNSDDFILKYGTGRVRQHLDLKAKYEGKIANLSSNIWESTASLLDDNKLTKWIDENYQVTVSQIILPRLKYFVSKISPQILGYFKVFTEFYEKEKIDFPCH